ncbi:MULTISPECIES: IucA/IucC family siderophore biosynthesis protein [Pseudomonas]|uniref:IucA/IucC family protein n=1 Tax=Pseudomonas TaxID=286 RepID=UPI00087A602A|nr:MULTISPECIES: IucA/IucC family protein [Pseudomonas]SDT90491.1 Siderophore synthetase component [Pseudomonas yamanorum]
MGILRLLLLKAAQKDSHLKYEYSTKPQWLLTRWSEALGTPLFQAHRITLDSLINTLAPAAERSFQRLIQALFREGLLNANALEYDDHHRCWLTLCNQTRLCFDHLLPGRMSSWDLRGNITAHSGEYPPHKVQFPSELLTLLNNDLQAPAAPEVLHRLNEELDDSFTNDTLCLAFHQQWTLQLHEAMDPAHSDNLLGWLKDDPRVANPTSLLEQWGTLGHPWHPNYKTKLGLSTDQVIDFSPEFEARFPVILCALHRQFAHVESLAGTADYWQWWQAHFPQAAQQLTAELTRQGLEAADYLPLPAHPWQARQELPQTFANEIGDRLLVLTDIVAFTAHPTMSFRTVLPEGRRDAPMVKLPVSLRLTSVQRTVSPRSARMGPRISHLMQTILAREPEVQKILGIVPERIGVHFKPQPADDERSRHLAVLYRDNPLNQLQPGEIAVPVGSLFAVDQHGQPLLRQWVHLAQGKDDSGAMQAFFRDYVAIAVPGLLNMYLRYGVAFEAHQQNSFMIMAADGQLSRLLLRDFGDIRIDRKTLHAQGLDIELHDPKMTLYDDAGFVRDKLLHTVFMCHLGELVLLGAREFDVPQALLWGELASQVSQCFDDLRGQVEPQRWATERQALLEQDWPAKSFMRMRLLESHADIVGRLCNPLSVQVDGN